MSSDNLNQKKVAVIVHGGDVVGRSVSRFAALASALGHAVTIMTPEKMQARRRPDLTWFDEQFEPHLQSPDRKLMYTVDYCSPQGLKALFTR